MPAVESRNLIATASTTGKSMSTVPLVLLSIGNPGPLTRHSVGHYILKLLMEKYQAKQPQLRPSYAISTNHDSSLVFIKSNSYMNESSKAWTKSRDRESIRPGSIIVVLYDDFEANVPKVKLSRFGKKNESHNGIRDLTSVMQADDERFKVFKLGVGIGPKPRDASRDAMSHWVLSPFKPVEKQMIAEKSFQLCCLYLQNIAECDGEIGDVGKFDARIKKIWRKQNE
ncbi:uncharacterized protein LODBEIA_P01740 [Lodderomyces beijingensis]|uniref:Peptidyl-tRNA hydrolase n=1 Tax=Lodderomyces beijingensis TaxID=1775926 RepID=A0ABP0ZCP5_9ASCO